VLVRQPDLLLLDEPTNHLDLAAIERLEAYLAEYPGAFLMVSHDRAFIQKTCREIVELENGKLVKYPYPYDKYVVERDARLERARVEYERQKEHVEKTEDFIRRNLAGQRTKQAQSRRKMLEKLERLERPEDQWQFAGRSRSPSPRRRARQQGDHPRAGADGGLPGQPDPRGRDRQHLPRRSRGHRGAERQRQVHAAQGRWWASCRRSRARWCAAAASSSATSIRSSPRCRGAHAARGDPDGAGRSLARGDPPVPRQVPLLRRRSVSARSRASPAASGSRLAMAKMMLFPRNVLALDEPTNHLDIPARETLEDALGRFEGTLIVVSHDRYFLDRVCQRLLIVEGDRLEAHLGNWSDYRERQREQARAARTAQVQAETKEERPPEDASPTASARTASKEKERQRRRLEKRVETLEAEVARIEGELSALRAELAADHQGDCRSSTSSPIASASWTSSGRRRWASGNRPQRCSRLGIVSADRRKLPRRRACERLRCR
jgi:ATP-binding cassette subfamily F protein 3